MEKGVLGCPHLYYRSCSSVYRYPRYALITSGSVTGGFEGRGILTPSGLGKHPRSCPERTRAGTHSTGSQYPLGPPQTWPGRMMIGFKGVCSLALTNTHSETHFDSVYPIPIAVPGWGFRVSGTAVPRVQSVLGNYKSQRLEDRMTTHSKTHSKC